MFFHFLLQIIIAILQKEKKVIKTPSTCSFKLCITQA